MNFEMLDPHDQGVKRCCAAFYAADWVRILLGDSLHPGGLNLTEQLGSRLGLGPGSRVLDVAAGRGASAIRLAERFGCQVLGVDYGADNVAAAQAAAATAGLAELVEFVEGDAEHLDVPDGSFDAAICECAFCTFPDKPSAAAELARILRAGGQLGLTDVARVGPLPPELDGLLGRVACVTDACPAEEYANNLERAGFRVDVIEGHDHLLRDMVDGVRTRLLGSQLLTNLGQIDIPGIDFEQAQRVVASAVQAVRDGRLGYVLIVATARPHEPLPR